MFCLLRRLDVVCLVCLLGCASAPRRISVPRPLCETERSQEKVYGAQSGESFTVTLTTCQ